MNQFGFDENELIIEELYFDQKGRRIRKPVYIHQDYPKVMYFQKTTKDTQGDKFKPKTVADAEQEAALGADWGATPVRPQDADTRE